MTRLKMVTGETRAGENSKNSRSTNVCGFDYREWEFCPLTQPMITTVLKYRLFKCCLEHACNSEPVYVSSALRLSYCNVV
jgi:hypothetical protein